jgi:hypothetical protein
MKPHVWRQITAIHEAGHAVGRLLTADDMGFSWEEAVHLIENAAARNGLPTTYGPWLSRDIDDCDGKTRTIEGVRRLVADAKARGMDVEKWARAKTLIIVCGPAAEAKYRGKPTRVIWFQTSSADDRNDAIRDCGFAGINSDDVVPDAIAKADAALARPNVWAAVRGIADAVLRTKTGKVSGEEVATIARRHMTHDRG